MKKKKLNGDKILISMKKNLIQLISPTPNSKTAKKNLAAINFCVTPILERKMVNTRNLKITLQSCLAIYECWKLEYAP